MNEIKSIIKKLVRFEDLSEAETANIMHAIMDGAVTPIQVAGFLLALHMKGETVAELVGAVKVMREKATRVKLKQKELIDIVGTGGDQINTFNISTASAFVVAAAGGTVLKHGNRSVSSRS